jgi:hypothetical protein
MSVVREDRIDDPRSRFTNLALASSEHGTEQPTPSIGRRPERPDGSEPAPSGDLQPTVTGSTERWMEDFRFFARLARSEATFSSSSAGSGRLARITPAGATQSVSAKRPRIPEWGRRDVVGGVSTWGGRITVDHRFRRVRSPSGAPKARSPCGEGPGSDRVRRPLSLLLRGLRDAACVRLRMTTVVAPARQIGPRHGESGDRPREPPRTERPFPRRSAPGSASSRRPIDWTSLCNAQESNRGIRDPFFDGGSGMPRMGRKGWFPESGRRR